MARDRERGEDSFSPSTGQSKRHSQAQDSDSLDSDQTQHAQHAHHGQHPHQSHQQQRKPHQKHHVGAGGSRLHAKTNSSKALYKHAATTSSTKLTRRLTSPSPDRSSSAATSHRRNHSTEVRLSRDPSATNLKKNASQTSLKRNRSHVEVGRRSKSSAQLKRSASEKAVHKLKPSKSNVHFDIGLADPQDDEDNEWVDASSSASPYLSRRGSSNNSGQSSAHALGSPRRPVSAGDGEPGHDTEEDEDGDEEPTPSAEPTRLLFDDATQHSRSLTSRLLQRTPSHSATTSMSNMTAMAKAASPDRRHSTSTLSVTPAPTEPQGMVGSNGTQEVTSRFITSQGSGGSFSTPSSRLDKTPRSLSGLSGPADSRLSTGTAGARDHEDEDDDDDGEGDDDELTDEEDTGITSAIATTARSRTDVGIPAAAPPEKSRTQQKINLQRASSSMEPVRHRHSGIGGFAAEVAEVAGPLLGGAGYESRDPRVNKLLERTGVEYNIVRRYQNPVARSLTRLAQLPGNDQARRIPRGNTTGTLSSRHSVHGFPAMSQSFRENGGSRTRPETPKRAFSSIRHSGAGSSLDTDDGAVGRMHEAHGQRLSGASLVNGEEDEGIQAILRSMWDKNLVDLAASAD